jgi:hypothetical protein
MVLVGRKKKGDTPTGILAHAAKAWGHYELLIKGSDMVAAAQTLTSLPMTAKKVSFACQFLGRQLAWQFSFV